MKGIREFFGSREAHLSRSCTQRFSSNEANHGRQNLRKHWKHRKSGKRAHRLRSSGITSTGSFSTFLCGVLVFCSVSRLPSARHPLLVLLSHTHTHTHNSYTHTQHCHTHTHNIVTHIHTTLSHTHTHRDTHTHTSLHTHTHTHNIVTQNSFTHLLRTLSHTTLAQNRSSTISFAFLAFPIPLPHLFDIIGRS